MKSKLLKSGLFAAMTLMITTGLRAQFDDVYYDPDAFYSGKSYGYDDNTPPASGEEIIYYDDDSYEYIDDYDYYYTSRIRRFYNPYIGFGFYDPIYVGFNYYDPWAYDYYAYPGASIYLSFGFGFNFFWNNWYYAPGGCYAGYNNWYYPSYTYWNGCGYYGNPYYNNPYCAPPGYYGGCGSGWGNNGNHHGGNDIYYGPRSAGNTGSSPRTNWSLPGRVAPTVKETDQGVADSNDKPHGLPEPGIPGRVNNPGNGPIENPDGSTGTPSVPKTNTTSGGIRQIPVDKDLTPDKTVTGSKRPVFRPDPERFQPYPSPTRPNPASGQTGPDASRPTGVRPEGNYRPYPQPEKQNDGVRSDASRPTSPVPTTKQDDRPHYTPPPRSTPKSDDRPGYAPSSRSHEESRQDRPSYTPPPRSNDRPSGGDRPDYSPPRQESQRSYDRPSHSPSSGGNNSSSSGSSRSSGGGGSSSSSSSSPRGRG